MEKKVIANVFKKAEEEYLEHLKSEEFNKGFDDTEKDFPNIIGAFAAKARSDSFTFTEKVLLELFESEEFKRELFKEMIE